MLLLGDWCLQPERYNSPVEQHLEIATPFSATRRNEDADHARARELERLLLPGLADLLNSAHGTFHGQRFWSVIVANWLRRTTIILFNRIETLRQATRNYRIVSESAYDPAQYQLACRSSASFVQAANDPLWNHCLFARLIESLNLETGTRVDLGPPPAASYDLDKCRTSVTPHFLRRVLEAVTRRCAARDKVFILNSYLPKQTASRLHLALGQLPQLWSMERPAGRRNVDMRRREMLGSQHAEILDDSDAKIMARLLWQMIPTSYLEDFTELQSAADEMGWPRDPDVIFTSNNYDYDDVFKIWAASHLARGAQYLVGQHGGNYGTHRHYNPFMEEATSDTFLTWGWDGDGMDGYFPGFVLKRPAPNTLRHNPAGGIVLFQLLSAYQIYLHDVIATFPEYFADQCALVDGLAPELRRDLTVRMTNGVRTSLRREHKLWADAYPDLKLEIGGRPADVAIAESRLVIFAYDSTGILETLSQNIPTLAFWQNGIDHIRDEARSSYQLLIDAKVIHLSGAALAAHLNEVGHDVESWWASENVQNAITVFRERYARTTNDPVGTLAPLIQRMQADAKRTKKSRAGT